MKNILFVAILCACSQVIFAQNDKIKRIPRVSRVEVNPNVTTNPVLIAPQTPPINDTISMPGATKDKRLLATFQPFVNKKDIQYKFSSSKAPNADGTGWFTTYGEGILNWNANGTKLIGSFTRCFSDKGFDKNKGAVISIEIDATNQKVVLNGTVPYTTEFKNGLLFGFNMANEIIVITLPTKSMQ